MSRMQKDREDARGDGLAERRLSGGGSRGLRERNGSGKKTDFARAFADALRDILVHERRRAA
jgi:hypothetical protein